MLKDEIPELSVSEVLALIDAIKAERPKAESLELVYYAWKLGYKRALEELREREN